MEMIFESGQTYTTDDFMAWFNDICFGSLTKLAGLLQEHKLDLSVKPNGDFLLIASRGE